jgi:hypothetical protein
MWLQSLPNAYSYSPSEKPSSIKPMEIIMTAYSPANGREITSQVLLKLRGESLTALPMACKTCPSAMWQITGKPDRPEAVTVRCYCPLMHTFTWDSRNQEEILDCEHLYEEDEEEEKAMHQPEQDDANDLPPFLRMQREKQLKEQAEAEQENPEIPEMPEVEM